MRTRYFYGWNVVGATFVMALWSFGLGFYGIAVYVAMLQQLHGWSASAVSAPVTVYYVAGALLTAAIASVYERFGSRIVVATAVGEAPAWCRNNRRRCRAVIPSVSARSPTLTSPSRKPRSINRSARETVAAAPRHAGVPGAVSGRHRKHGRNPARSAAAAVGKNTTFFDFAGFTGHVGRQ